MDMIKIGPVGRESDYGTVWDERGRDQIAGICVYYNDATVLALVFLFYENGKLVKSNKFGYVSGNLCGFSAVVFDYSTEFITSIKGCFQGNNYLKTISFGTNKGSYGPFGCTTSTDDNYIFHSANDLDFNFQLGNHRFFGGLYGTYSSDGINSIGIYVKPLKDPQVKDEKD